MMLRLMSRNKLVVAGGDARAKQRTKVEEKVSDFNSRDKFTLQHFCQCLVDNCERLGDHWFACVDHVVLLSMDAGLPHRWCPPARPIVQMPRAAGGDIGASDGARW